jgi:four helix bundle protein
LQAQEKEHNMTVADYKELRVYILAFDSAMAIFELSRSWPSGEKYSLTDQIRRSSRSVCTNIAEAWRKRRYEAAFISKLSDSDGEAAETEVHLDFALRCGYLPADKHAKLRDHYDHVCRQLTKMMADASAWCGTGGGLSELPPDYFVERESVERESVERESVERESVRKTLLRSHTPDAPRSTVPNAPRSSRS